MTTILLLVASFFTSGGLDIFVIDTYFVISIPFLHQIIAALFFVFAIVMWSIQRLTGQLSTGLSWLHYTLTVACFLILTLCVFKIHNEPKYIDSHTVDNLEEYKSQIVSLDTWIRASIYSLALSQFIFIVKAIRAFLLKWKRS